MRKINKRPSALFFTTGCNEQVFSPNPENNFGADSCYRFQEKRKTA